LATAVAPTAIKEREMKSKLFLLAALVALALATVQVIADDMISEGRPPFTVIYVSQIDAEGQKSAIRAKATRTRVAEIQREIASDPVLVRKLRARGIQFRNIIGRERSFNGRLIFYVR
jgi:hypothetical protein